MPEKITPARSGATGPGKGDVFKILEAMQKDMADLRTKFNAHLQDGSHTAAANTTAGNVTTNTMPALRTEL